MFMVMTAKIFNFIFDVIIFIVRLIFHTNVTLPIMICLILSSTWGIYEFFHMNFSIDFSADLVDRWVSKYICPPMCMARIVSNIFGVFSFLTSSDVTNISFDYKAFTFVNFFAFSMLFLTILSVIFFSKILNLIEFVMTKILNTLHSHFVGKMSSNEFFTYSAKIQKFWKFLMNFF